MRRLFSILSFVLLYVTIAFGQAAVDFTVTVEDNVGNVQVLNFGLDLTATDGIDAALGESDLPPPPPGNAFDARFWLPPFAGTLSSWLDYRAPGATPPGAFPFTGQKSHVIKFQSTDFPITISWTGLPPEILASSVIEDPFAIGSESFSGTGSFVVSLAAIPQVNITIDYANIGPSGPAPDFVLSPTSLDFGPVGIGVPSVLQANVSNPGTDPLDITAISSTDPQFTFSPATATIPAGGNLDFDITFTPTTLGTQSGDIEFVHNAPSSPDLLAVTGVGADAGPTFGVSPGSLNFGTVVIPGSQTLQLTVANNGLTNTLNISSVTATLPEYTVAPGTATIPPGGTEVFDVTFTPSSANTFAGDVTFVHNGTTSPDLVPVTGDGFVPAAVNGLVFEEDTVWNLEANFHSATMQLLDLAPGEDVQALQFRLLTNMQVDDNTILTFQSMVKGSDVSDPSWVLDYNIARGPITANGASEDTIYVVLYNLNQNNPLVGNANYLDLLEVNYRVADLPALVDSSKSSFLIMEAEASTFEGFPIDITPSRNELVVWGKNRTGSYGDVNGDGCLDILDLILVVDHIVSRDSLDADEFVRADIAPWTPGNIAPDPDGFVNVQDLALIQNIILTGFFPDGTPVGPCGPPLAKYNGDADAIVDLYINSEGISAYLDSKVGIRGAQIEFGSVVDDPGNLVINTELGQGYYLHIPVEEMFRTLQYDRLAEKFIDAGKHFMTDMPFVISNPEDVTLEKLVLVDINTQKVMKLEVNIIYGTPTLPLDYVLWQNYPNPFNPSTAVRFQVPKSGNVTIKIYDMLGQEIRTLFAEEVLRGTYTVNWDGLSDAGTKMSSGTYIYRMIAGEFMQSKKMILLK